MWLKLDEDAKSTKLPSPLVKQNCPLNPKSHYDFGMMEQFVDQLSVKSPNIILDAHYPNDSMSVAGIMKQSASEIINCQYACVIVYGDTNSSLVAALAVSETCRLQLQKEKAPGHIEVVGDPQFDVFIEVAVKVLTSSAVRCVHAGTVGLATLYRAENVDYACRLGKILLALSIIVETDEIEWIFPVHPRTRRNLTNLELLGIRLVDPLSYEELLRVLK